MAVDKVITGAIAVIMDANQNPIGRMKSIQVTENITRAEVRGLGSLCPVELPATAWGAGTLRCSFFNIDFSKSQVPGAINRRTGNSVEQFEDNITMQEDGVTVVIYKKSSDLIDPVTKNIKASPKVYATVKNLYIDTESFDISDGQVSGRDQSFKYMTPIQYEAATA